MSLQLLCGPQRFSEQFLHEEREKPKLYRESVRQHYTQLCIGTMEVLPTDLSHPLSLGQQVVAIHPETVAGDTESQVYGHSDFGEWARVTLTGALQSGSSPQFSQKSYNKFECRKPTPVQSYDRMRRLKQNFLVLLLNIGWCSGLGARNMSLDLIEEVQACWWIWKVLLPVKFIKKGKNYDESTCLGALLTLAHLSTAMLPTSTVESGSHYMFLLMRSPVHLKLHL
ncbi:hypothetical protein V6N11_007104 [Hibiscus sabdariffa]|uniref:DIRP domain-containing protein n=1 Tax=Hibiscus sabdariffa TaxID=183260 RepID=A0ABR2RT19_9ROSI